MDPAAALDPRFSNAGFEATTWEEAVDVLRDAETYWISTVRPVGRPHVTPIAGVWLDDEFCFVTGSDERKARNLALDPSCALTTGCSRMEGLDVVVEGRAEPIRDRSRLERLAEAYVGKYGDLFLFEAREGALFDLGAARPVLAFAVRASRAFAFAKGDEFGQTRFSFGDGGVRHSDA